MKWEYKEVTVKRELSEFSNIEDALNHFGESGWELVAFQILAPVTGSLFHAVFKRPNQIDLQNASEMKQ